MSELHSKIKLFWARVKPYLIRFFNAAWDYIKTAKIELIVIAGVIFIDLLTKGIVEANMAEGESITVIRNFFNITFVHNYQAAFGGSFGLDKIMSLDAIRVLFLVLTSVAMVGFSCAMYRFRGKHMFSRLCFALIIGGAFGNFYDRAAIGYVRDMFEFVYFGYECGGSTSFAVFNVADAALVAGVIMFAVYFIFMYKEPQKPFVGPVQQFLGADGQYHPKDYDPEADVSEEKEDKENPLKSESETVSGSSDADKKESTEKLG